MSHLVAEAAAVAVAAATAAIENHTEARLLHHLLHHYDHHAAAVRCLSLAEAQNSHLRRGKCATIRSSVNNALRELQTDTS